MSPNFEKMFKSMPSVKSYAHFCHYRLRKEVSYMSLFVKLRSRKIIFYSKSILPHHWLIIFFKRKIFKYAIELWEKAHLCHPLKAWITTPFQFTNNDMGEPFLKRKRHRSAKLLTDSIDEPLLKVRYLSLFPLLKLLSTIVGSLFS